MNGELRQKEDDVEEESWGGGGKERRTGTVPGVGTRLLRCGRFPTCSQLPGALCENWIRQDSASS